MLLTQTWLQSRKNIASLGLLTARPGVASQHLCMWPDVTAVKPNLSRLLPRWKVTVRDFFLLN